jgi:hypothetical protein
LEMKQGRVVKWDSEVAGEGGVRVVAHRTET